MSMRSEFEQFCRRTRPAMSTARDLLLSGKWGEYSNNSTNAAWRTWQYLHKQNNPKPARAVPAPPERA